MTDYAKLKTEIAKPEYAGLSDAQIAAAVNQKTITLQRDFSHRAARDALIFTTAGDWGNVVGVADGVITAGVNLATRVRCVSLREALRGGMNDMFQATNSNHWTKLLAAIDAVSPAYMSAEGKNNIIALGQYTVPLGEYWGWPGPVPGQVPAGIGDGDVAAARNWNG